MKKRFLRVSAAFSTVLFLLQSSSIAVHAQWVGPIGVPSEQTRVLVQAHLSHEILETEDGQFRYQVERDPHLSAMVLEYIGDSGDVVFHDYTGIIRTTTSKVDCSGRDDITSVTYKGGYHFGVYEDNFQNCKNLESLTIDPTMTDTLLELYFPEDEYPEDRALWYTNWSMSHLGLPGSFSGCTALKNITFGYSYKAFRLSVGKSVFEGCTALEHLETNGCIGFAEDAFVNCTALKEVVFTERIKWIEDHAFGYQKDKRGNYTRYDGLTFYGVPGTVAETYALENDIPFVCINSVGDLDDSGDMDIADVVLLSRFLAEDADAVITEKGMPQTDINRDGITDANDIIMMLRILTDVR